MTALENHRRLRQYACILAVMLCTLPGVKLKGQQAADDSLSSLSMEELINMDVSSVARREQKLYKTPAAVFVVTRDDIQRSGAVSLPEALRMVPGVEVAQVQGNLWAVSARGFNGVIADKMLVMIDGRSIYNLDWSGTYWDMNAVPLDTIERIEVIRGPGATMWGANAVNGVINIITLKAQKTVGTSVSIDAGNLARGAEMRYGHSVSNNLQLRTFAQYQRASALLNADGGTADDGGRAMRAGIRLDWQPGTNDTVYLHGDIFRGREDQQEFAANLAQFQDKVSDNGGYALARWEHRMSGSDTALQFYYEDQNRWENLAAARLGSLDLDFQDHISSVARHDIMWGFGARSYHDHMRGTHVGMLHDEHTVMLGSSFLQDDFSIVPDKVVLTVGSKVDWNTYTHIEIQPSVRMLWTPDAKHSVWGAVSRPVRTPSFRDRDLNLTLPVPSPYPIPTATNLQGNPDFKSEDTLVYEGGYRQRIQRRLSADLAGFFAHYTRLETDQQGEPYTVFQPTLEEIIPVLFTNQAHAKTEGLEASVIWNPIQAYHLSAAYSWEQCKMASSSPTASVDADWAIPRNSMALRNDFDLTRHWTIDTALYAVSATALSAQPGFGNEVPAYQRVDASLGYGLSEGVHLRIGGRNLQSSQHYEFNPDDYYISPSAIPRSVFAKLDWRF